jgi:hypothetical protein
VMAADIYCPIELFPRQETEIARLVLAINQAATIEDKLRWAQYLIDAADELLACQSYNDGSPDCRLCHNFSGLRHKTADLIVKASRLSR